LKKARATEADDSQQIIVKQTENERFLRVGKRPQSPGGGEVHVMKDEDEREHEASGSICMVPMKRRSQQRESGSEEGERCVVRRRRKGGGRGGKLRLKSSEAGVCRPSFCMLYSRRVYESARRRPAKTAWECKLPVPGQNVTKSVWGKSKDDAHRQTRAA
jgi:hypothetical protein